MSFLIRSALRPLSTLRPSALRPFHSTGFRAALNETDRDRDNLHEEIDHHKNDQLQKQKEGKGHWKGELASSSEASIKADREEIEASEDNISKLQKETESYAQKTNPDAKK